MTAKETFLSRLKAEEKSAEEALKAIQSAYKYNASLPDSFFENLFTPVDKLPTNPVIDDRLKINNEAANDYGKNKKLVAEIVMSNGRALLKSAIIKSFEEQTGLQNQTQQVTNAISALSSDGVLIGYKADGHKVRGNYWTMVNWWEGKTLLKQHEPEPFNPLNKLNLSA